MVLLERDDRACAGRVAQPVQHQRRLVLVRLVAQHQLHDHGVHAGVGLMQPVAPHVLRRQPVVAEEFADEARRGLDDFLEHLVADLGDHVALHPDDRGVVLAGAQQVAEIGADVVGELCPASRVQHLEAAGPHRAVLQALHHQRHRGVAEDEMRLPVAEIEMAGDEFRRHHQHPALRARTHHVEGDVQRRRGRRAAEVHVEGRALGADRVLDLDRHRRIRPLVMRARQDDHVDVGARHPGIRQRPLRRGDAELSHHRQRLVRARRDARRHAGGVENAVQRVDVAAPDPRGMDDEIAGRLRQRRLAARGAAGVLGIHPGIEALDQFVVADRGLGDFHAHAADDDSNHRHLFPCAARARRDASRPCGAANVSRQRFTSVSAGRPVLPRARPNKPSCRPSVRGPRPARRCRASPRGCA